jgi:hypothetical protein
VRCHKYWSVSAPTGLFRADRPISGLYACATTLLQRYEEFTRHRGLLAAPNQCRLKSQEMFLCRDHRPTPEYLLRRDRDFKPWKEQWPGKDDRWEA